MIEDALIANNTYLVVNGVKVQLTEEQKKCLGLPSENPFGYNEDLCYYLVTTSGTVDMEGWNADPADRCFAANLNCFKTKEFAKQIALSQLLRRKLLKFGYDNNCTASDIWEDPVPHWCIYYDFKDKTFKVDSLETCKYSDVYFSAKERAQQAIEEVVLPFMSEHPEFEW